jgi:hypothetical protein
VWGKSIIRNSAYYVNITFSKINSEPEEESYRLASPPSIPVRPAPSVIVSRIILFITQELIQNIPPRITMVKRSNGNTIFFPFHPSATI